MKTTTRNLAAIVLLGASTLVWGVSGCKKADQPEEVARIESREEKEVLGYLRENPASQEPVMNYIMLLRNKENTSYSKETVDNIYRTLKKEMRENPSELKEELVDMTRIGLYSEYSSEIFAGLPFKEKVRIAKECSLYGASELGDELKEDMDKVGNKLEEYQPETVGRIKGTIRSGLERVNADKATERVKRDAGRFYENVKEKIYGNN